MMLRYVPSIPAFWVKYSWLLFFPFYQFQYIASLLFSLQSFCGKVSGESYESSLVCNLWIFLAAFSILSLSFAILMTVCFDVFLFGFIMFETPFVSWTWMSVSFPRLGSFQLFHFHVFSWLLSLFSPSMTPKTWMLVYLMLSQRSPKLSSFHFILFSFLLFSIRDFGVSNLWLAGSFLCIVWSTIGSF